MSGTDTKTSTAKQLVDELNKKYNSFGDRHHAMIQGIWDNLVKDYHIPEDRNNIYLRTNIKWLIKNIHKYVYKYCKDDPDARTGYLISFLKDYLRYPKRDQHVKVIAGKYKGKIGIYHGHDKYGRIKIDFGKNGKIVPIIGEVEGY